MRYSFSESREDPVIIVRLISELKRRNVFRMAVLYVVAAWLVMQVAEVVIGLANLPEIARLVIQNGVILYALSRVPKGNR